MLVVIQMSRRRTLNSIRRARPSRRFETFELRGIGGELLPAGIWQSTREKLSFVIPKARSAEEPADSRQRRLWWGSGECQVIRRRNCGEISQSDIAIPHESRWRRL